MNKTFAISVVAVFVVFTVLGFLVHGVILGEDWGRFAAERIYRSPESAQAMWPLMLVSTFLFAVGFTWIYRMGRQNKPWAGQGLRFGLAVALFATVPVGLIYYVMLRIPSDFTAKRIVLDSIMVVALGLVAAFINRDPLPPRA